MTDKDFKVSREKVGALDRNVVRWGDDIDRDLEMQLMFPFADAEASHRMCREARFPDYPATTAEPLETLARRYTGAAPAPEDAKDIAAAQCWLMVHFATAHHDYQAAKDRGDIDAALRAGFLLGRLVEWWRWRREGHDRRAAGKRSSEEALPKAREKSGIGREFGADWHEDARQEALEMKNWNRKRTRWNIAQELAPKFGVSPRHMSEVIKPVLP